jgi:TonB-dependent SusC/RagA subfamily outer membrane receptor
MMMNSKKSSFFSLTRYGLMLPAVVALLLVFGTSKAELIKKSLNQANQITHKAITAAQNLVLTSSDKDGIKAHVNTPVHEKKRTRNKLNAVSGAISIVHTEINIADTPKVRVIPQKAIMFPPGSESTYCILNGKKITTQQANNIETDKIESITVLKGSSATTIFGDAASQGAVLIVTKGQENSSAVQSIMQKVASVRAADQSNAANAGSSTFSTASPAPNTNANTFSTAPANPDSANKSHNSPRPVVAIGSKTQNRTITVRGYASPQKKISVGPNGSLREIVVQGFGTERINGNTPGTKFLVDGKEVTKEEFEALDPNKIESINVIKDAAKHNDTVKVTTKSTSKPASKN